MNKNKKKMNTDEIETIDTELIKKIDEIKVFNYVPNSNNVDFNSTATEDEKIQYLKNHYDLEPEQIDELINFIESDRDSLESLFRGSLSDDTLEKLGIDTDSLNLALSIIEKAVQKIDKFK